VFRVHLSCDFRLLFLIKFGEILIFLAENLAHSSQKNLAQNVNTFAFFSCQIFVVDHSKTSSFFAFKTCSEIIRCNSIAIIHYFWKTKVLNLKNVRVSDRFSCMIHHWKAQISHSIFVSVARQPDKHVLKYHARKLRCIARYSLANLRTHMGALHVNELN
jgi:hypothetical protein